MTNFLPVTMQELLETGVSQPDFVYITGDAYVDHPSFGAAIITRLLQSQGYSVAVLAQPDWHTVKDFTRFGKPRLAFLVTGGNIDSMVAHYTSAKRKRSTDMYSPGGRAGLRPDRAVITYCRKIREAYPDAAIAIGGLEASLRRFAHYDYWDDTVRPSILADSGADLLMYGMGEHQITELAQLLAEGVPIQEITDIRGTCYLTSPENTPWGGVQCPDYAQVCRDKKAYAKATRQQYDQQDEITGKTVFDAADRGDEPANAVVDRFCDYLGAGVTNIVNALAPEVILIGGGISRQGERLLAPVRRYVEKNCFGGKDGAIPIIAAARLGNDAGIIGAAAL